MIQPTRAKVIQKPGQIKSKYGFCSILKIKLLNTNEEVAIFSKENDSNILKRYIDEEVEVYRDAKNKWRLIDNDSIRNVNGGGLHHISTTFSTSTNKSQEDIINDVPMLSDADKKKVAKFIQQQSKLLRYTVDVLKADFPELVGVDDRGIRSMALSLLINTNQMINRNL